MIHKNISVKKSQIEGRGLFADARISKGQQVLIFEGDSIRSQDLGNNVDLGDLFPTGPESYLVVHEPEMLINHSCQPNTGFKDEVSLVSIKDIEPGEEVTFDYSTVGTDGWEIKCNCGSKACRGKIADYKFLPSEIKSLYKTITPTWVLEFEAVA